MLNTGELILWLEKILFEIKNNNKFWYEVSIFILIIIKMKYLKVHIFDYFNIKYKWWIYKIIIQLFFFIYSILRYL